MAAADGVAEVGNGQWSPQRLRLAGALALTVLLVVVVLLALTVDVDVALIVLIAATLIAPIAVRIAQRRFDPFEPIVLFALAWGVMFVVRPVGMVLNDVTIYRRSTVAIDISDSFTTMLTLALVGAVALVAGYALPIGRVLAARLLVRRVNVSTPLVVAGAVAAGLFGVFLYALFIIDKGGIDTFITLMKGRNPDNASITRDTVQYFRMGPYITAGAAVLLLSLGIVKRNIVAVLAGGFGALIVLALALPTGSRMLMFPLVGGLFIFAYVSRGKRPSVLLLAVLVVLALIGSTVIGSSRTVKARQERGTVAILTHVVTHPSTISDRLFTSGDTEMAATLSAVLARDDVSDGYTWGTTTLGDLVTRPVPRRLWTSKPEVPRTRIVEELWPREFATGNANPEFSTLLYFYLDLGTLGVILGMAAYGILFRLLYEWFRAGAGSAWVQVLYALTTPFTVIGMRDSPTDTFMRFALVVLPVLAVVMAARRLSAFADEDVASG